MKTTGLVASLQNEERDEKLCKDVVDATFELLATMVTLEKSLSIDGIGTFGAHERKGLKKELPNAEGTFSQKNLSIFFHPSLRIKEDVSTLVEDAPTD